MFRKVSKYIFGGTPPVSDASRRVSNGRDNVNTNPKTAVPVSSNGLRSSPRSRKRPSSKAPRSPRTHPSHGHATAESKTLSPSSPQSSISSSKPGTSASEFSTSPASSLKPSKPPFKPSPAHAVKDSTTHLKPPSPVRVRTPSPRTAKEPEQPPDVYPATNVNAKPHSNLKTASNGKPKKRLAKQVHFKPQDQVSSQSRPPVSDTGGLRRSSREHKTRVLYQSEIESTVGQPPKKEKFEKSKGGAGSKRKGRKNKNVDTTYKYNPDEESTTPSPVMPKSPKRLPEDHPDACYKDPEGEEDSPAPSPKQRRGRPRKQPAVDPLNGTERPEEVLSQPAKKRKANKKVSKPFTQADKDKSTGRGNQEQEECHNQNNEEKQDFVISPTGALFCTHITKSPSPITSETQAVIAHLAYNASDFFGSNADMTVSPTTENCTIPLANPIAHASTSPVHPKPRRPTAASFFSPTFPIAFQQSPNYASESPIDALTRPRLPPSEIPSSKSSKPAKQAYLSFAKVGDAMDRIIAKDAGRRAPPRSKAAQRDQDQEVGACSTGNTRVLRQREIVTVGEAFEAIEEYFGTQLWNGSLCDAYAEATGRELLVSTKGLDDKTVASLKREAQARANKLRLEGHFERLKREQRGVRSETPSPEG